MEEKKPKKRYEKPVVTRIKLDAKCAVLGFCKGPAGGPTVGACDDGFGDYCLSFGS
ncbi:MAG: hypothetical protein MUD16_18280 [Desulfobacterales bacterium]|jgi:hypothetical protein|nr:hypothetical protein [Desulfobacterales bacterium]